MIELKQQKQQQPGIFLVLSILVVILAADAAGATANDAEGSSPSKDKITGLFESNATRSSSGGLKAGEENVDVSGSGENNPDEEIGAEEEEYEGEDEGDEYAEELRAAAESHEAMSRHDKLQARNQSGPNSEDRGSINPSDNIEASLDAAKKDFDSKEKSVESGSDESESSNETVVEGSEPEDEEVTELIKYKNTKHIRRDESAKRKRVPTVKKELSTQTEIKTVNSSEIEKRFSTKQMLDQLNKQFEEWTVFTKDSDREEASTSIPKDSSGKTDEVKEETEPDEYSDRNPSAFSKLQTDTKSDNPNSEELEEPRKVEKRQETVLRDLETYLRAEYAAEQEQQQKLEELGAQEGALAESLLELLVKLAENPRRWERVHRLLMDVEGGLELSRQALEARKRAFNLTSIVATTTATSPTSTTPKKPRKKPKKKKKKQRHHRFSTATTTLPTTIPLLTTTEAPWLTTPMQWRLVAERLFGPPWPQDLQDDPGLAKVRFTVPSNSRSSTPGREFVDQLSDSKQLEDHKALNTERQALMLESSREYTQPRHLHYGKVNTHQGVTSHSKNRDNSRVRDYDPPERASEFDAPRYGQFDYPRARIQPDEFYPVQSYAQNHEYRPPGREYAASKSWHDSQYKYGRPNWKSDDDRGVDSPPKWTWPQLEDPKPSWHREYWPRIQHDNEGKVWPQSQRGRNEAWEKDSWTKSSSWSPQDGGKGSYNSNEGVSPPWENPKNRNDALNSNLSGAQLKDSTKTTVKGWSGVNQERETWEFKDRKETGYDNGDKEEFGKSLQKDEKPGNPLKYKYNGKSKSKAQKTENRERVASWNSEMNTNPKIWPPKTAISPKIQSVGAWVMPVDQSTWKPYNLKTVEAYADNNEGESTRHRWNVEMDTNPRTWPPKIGQDQWNKFGKPSNGVAWPKWKQFAYHRVTAMPILSSGGGGSMQDGTRARNNAYIAVSAVSPKYNGNQWRKNDIEETPVVQTGSNTRLQDSEHPGSQLRGGVEPGDIYTWKKDGDSKNKPRQSQSMNGTGDPLEEQLETLRRGTSSWSHNENRDNIKKQLNAISDASETLASRFPSTSSVGKPETSLIQVKEETIKGGNIDQDNKKVSHK